MVVLIATYTIIARFNVRLVSTAASGTRYEAGVEAASIVIGYDASTWQPAGPAGWSVRTTDYSWLRADAWRPYHHALAPLPKSSPYHFLVVPLWYLPVAAIGYACFTHGVIRGMRHAALNACTRCGYDLSMIAGPRADRVCPECGQRQGSSPSAGRQAVESAAVVEVKLPIREVPAPSDAGAPHSGQGAAASSPSRE